MKEIIADLGVNFAKEHLHKAINEHQLHRCLEKYIESQQKYNEMCSRAEEIDFQGLINYISENLLDDVSSRITCTKSRDRNRARNNIVEKAISYAHAETPEAQSRIKFLIFNTLDIIHSFFCKKVSVQDWVLAADIVDAVGEEVTDAKNELKEDIKQSVQTLERRIDEQRINSQFSLESFYVLGKQKDTAAIEERIKMSLEAASSGHPLYPDYGFGFTDNHLISRALTPSATKKYPPKMICSGTVKMGDEYLESISEETLRYADRHQLPIELDITVAKKLLGQIADPDQTEAQEMIGKTIVRKPKEFPPAFPCSIKINGEVFVEYIELRTAEILDDGTYIVNNNEQTDCHYRVELRFRYDQKDNIVHYNIRTENATNRDLLTVARMMKLSSGGGNMEIYSLDFGKNILAGNITPFEVKAHLGTIDEEIDFLEGLCIIEEYSGKHVGVPYQISNEDINVVHYAAKLINGDGIKRKWKEQTFKGKVTPDLRTFFTGIGENYLGLSCVGSSVVEIFGVEVIIPIVRKYASAQIKDYERFIKKLEYTNDGEEIYVTFVAGPNNLVTDTLCTSEDEEDAEKGLQLYYAN